MALQNFDQLNDFRKMAQKWFDVMDVTPEEKQARVDLSLDYCEIIIMLFLLITEQEYEKEECVAFTEERLRILAERQIGKENIAYINTWAKQKAKSIVDQTYEFYENEIEDSSLEESEESDDMMHFEEFGVDVPKKEYGTSDFRAFLISINLATTVTNFQELSDAIDRGCTRKTWVTEGDDRVRDTHAAVNGQDIPINDLFVVGNSYMLMPGDENNGAEMKEVSNCRCHLVCYTNQ